VKPAYARYRVGATSFIHPAGWLENAERVAGRVQDVELLLFEPPSPATAPSPAEVAGLARLGRAAGLTYSVHAPVVALASADEGRRRAAVEAVVRAAEVTAPLDPHALILHLEPDAAPGGPEAWRERAARSLRELVAAGVPPERIAVENLDDDLALAEPLIEELGLSVALDVGHLARDGVALAPVLAQHLRRARVVHWHGTDASGRDHRSLRHYPRAEGVALLRALAEAGWAGVVTLEVFREADLDESLAVLAELDREALA
jgi:sugar phosphate isomerase/epimerase